eukprot:5068349-Karenia_brevis.AAC.1
MVSVSSCSSCPPAWQSSNPAVKSSSCRKAVSSSMSAMLTTEQEAKQEWPRQSVCWMGHNSGAVRCGRR